MTERQFASRQERDPQAEEAAQRETEAVAAEQDAAVEAGAEQAEKLKADLDGLLDEIEEVLEVNAAEFVKGYIQQGGQ